MAESTKRNIVDGMDFSRIFMFQKLLGSCTASLQLSRLLIGLLMVAAVMSFGKIWDSQTEKRWFAAGFPSEIVDASLASRGSFEFTSDQAALCLQNVMWGVVMLEPGQVSTNLKNLLIDLPSTLWHRDRVFFLSLALVLLMVYVIGGGALSRMAACQFAGGARLGLDDAIDFAILNWIRITLALLLPLVLAGFFAGVIILLGALMLAPILDILGGVVYGLALLLGFLLTFVLVGYAGGAVMILPAVACERCDGPDANQRAFSFVYQRPLHLAGYGLISLLGLVLGFLVVCLFTGLMLNLTGALFGILAGGGGGASGADAVWFNLNTQQAGSEIGTVASGLIAFWHTLVICLALGYLPAYFCDVTTRLYLLMRRACDGQGIEEIWWPGMAPGTVRPLRDESRSELDQTSRS